MTLVETVLSLAEGRTPEEIARQSALSLADVERVVDFLARYSFVKTRGSKMKVDEALMSLPTD